MDSNMKKQFSTVLCTLAGLGALLLADASHAQMQIPNPLMRPQPVKQPVASDPQNLNSPLPQGPGSPPPNASRSSVPPPVSSDFLRTAPVVSQESKPDAVITELRQRFDAFYVSATVGDQAVLRRGAAVQNSSAQASVAPATAGAVSRQATPGLGAVGRADSLIVRDGEAIEFLGSSVTLVPKVSGGRVSLYYYSNGGAGSNKKKGAQPVQVVFMGEVESQAPSVPSQIVLEKPDPAYKATISPETRPLVSSNGINGSNGSSPNGVAGAAPTPAY
ncbi:hypothetical protein [Noviherbaspirillum suwonense]|nr:hypothetical protein [Noviherbaspirillum suwonense]